MADSGVLWGLEQPLILLVDGDVDGDTVEKWLYLPVFNIRPMRSYVSFVKETRQYVLDNGDIKEILLGFRPEINIAYEEFDDKSLSEFFAYLEGWYGGNKRILVIPRPKRLSAIDVIPPDRFQLEYRFATWRIPGQSVRFVGQKIMSEIPPDPDNKYDTLVLNGGFENGIWGTPAIWAQQCYSGSYSMKLNAQDQINNGNDVFSNYVKVSPGMAIDWNCVVKATVIRGACYFSLYFYDENKRSIIPPGYSDHHEDLLVISQTQDWTNYGGTHTIPQDVVYVRYRLMWWEQNNNIDGDCWIDNVSIMPNNLSVVI